MTVIAYRHSLRRASQLTSRLVTPPSLTIEIGAATASASTELAAFDAALCELGVGDVNLIRLSSVIPPNSEVSVVDRVAKPLGWGDRLYCVYAYQAALRAGETAAAGIGWMLRNDRSGAGLFVEHEASTSGEVRELIVKSLQDMAVGRGGGFEEPHMQIIETPWAGRPTCALVLAAYDRAGWKRADR